jgi:general stress protein CsbA
VRGRIFSSLEAVIHLAFMVFMFVAAYLAKYIDRFWIITLVGTAFLLCGITGLISGRRNGVT